MVSHEFTIWRVTVQGLEQCQCFDEVALALHEAFAALGREVPVVTDPAEVRGVALVLGANLLPQVDRATWPEEMVLYNLEQVLEGSYWFGDRYPGYVELLKHYPVWDYSVRNLQRLKAMGIGGVLCGVGYMPGLTRIAPASTEDIDILFVGSMNERRKQLLQHLGMLGFKVAVGVNVWGKERDALIARAKIVLNMHFFEARVFEIVRVSYLLANSKVVVSEPGEDGELEAPFQEGVVFADYGEIPRICGELLVDDARRKALARRGFEIFSEMGQVGMLERALASTRERWG